jgi:hypothetical protein
MPKGSLVVMSTNGTEKTDLIRASTFWLAAAFAAGFGACYLLKKRGSRG